MLEGEAITEFAYEPVKCAQPYRLVVVRKNLSVQRREQVLIDEVRYFFYLTNRLDLTAGEVVALANQRCNQENVIAQLKGAVPAMRMPVNDLNSNRAYMGWPRWPGISRRGLRYGCRIGCKAWNC